MNTCTRCSIPLTERRLTSRALEAAFCSWACYEGEWKEEMPRCPARGGLPVDDSIDYVDMEGPMETNVSERA